MSVAMNETRVQATLNLDTGAGRHRGSEEDAVGVECCIQRNGNDTRPWVNSDCRQRRGPALIGDMDFNIATREYAGQLLAYEARP